MFLGEFECKADKAQRRIAIPSSWRTSDEAHFVFLPGRDNTLLVMSPEKAQEMLKKLTSTSFGNRDAQKALAMIGSFALDGSCDKKGRIALTQKLFDYAQINEEIVFIGAFDSFQIWSKDNWSKMQFDVNGMLDVIQNIQEQPDDVGKSISNLMNTLK